MSSVPTNMIWMNIGGTVMGPLNTQTETNATGLQRFYRVIAPFTLPYAANRI
jgi:hypothetical protein